MDNNRKVVELPLDDVLPNRFQPRIKFNEESINELAESIKEHGVIQPIVVRPVGDRYEIIAGERRYKATTLAGLKTIPAIITDLNDKDSAEVALIENVQRQNLTPIEEAISYKKILDMGYLTQEDLAEKLGKNQSTIANKLRLLNLDEEVQEALLNEKISERHARSLLKLQNYDDQVKLLKRIINERLTVRKTDEEISKMLNNQYEEQNQNNIEVLDLDEPIIIPTDEEEINPSVISDINIPSTPIIEQPTEINNNHFIDQTQSFSINNTEPSIPKFNDLLNKDADDSDDAQLTPSKFFNIFDETQNDTSSFNENLHHTENNNINSDFSSMFNTPNDNQEEFNISSNFGIPKVDDSEFNKSLLNQAKDSFGNNTYIAGDIKTVVNTIRNCADTIEKYGFKVDIDEFDLEDMYQVVFKVFKK